MSIVSAEGWEAVYVGRNEEERTIPLILWQECQEEIVTGVIAHDSHRLQLVPHSVDGMTFVRYRKINRA